MGSVPTNPEMPKKSEGAHGNLVLWTDELTRVTEVTVKRVRNGFMILPGTVLRHGDSLAPSVYSSLEDVADGICNDFIWDAPP